MIKSSNYYEVFWSLYLGVRIIRELVRVSVKIGNQILPLPDQFSSSASLLNINSLSLTELAKREVRK